MTTTADTTTSVELTLTHGLVGFPLARRFHLSESQRGLYDMQCIDIPDMSFVVVSPSPFFPDYSPVIDPETAERLELSSPEDALVLLLVNLGGDNEDPGANLLAPVVVNRHTRQAVQVVLVDQDLPLRATLPVN